VAIQIEREREPSVTVADGLLITSYNSSLQVRRFYDKFKRAFDLILAGILLILTAPTWLIIALWIRMTSKGPIFFKQRRTGLHGKPFDMLKFRSMYVDAPVYANSPQDSTEQTHHTCRSYLAQDEPRRVTTVTEISCVVICRLWVHGQRCPLSLSNTLRLNDFDSRCHKALTGFWQLKRRS